MSTVDLPNGRDLGGHRAAGGSVVAAGRLFRCGAPTLPDHAAALERLGVGLVADLRTEAEREQIPAALPRGSRLLRADLLAEEPEDAPASLGRIARAALAGEAKHLTRDEVRQMYLHGYRSFVTLPGARRETARLLSALVESGTGPALFHCTAGKDRTGWVAALILLSLGVDADDVMADYLTSGPRVAAMFADVREMVADEGGDLDTFDFVLGVYPEYLNEALATMADAYGTLARFLTDGLGLPPDYRDRLGARLLTLDP